MKQTNLKYLMIGVLTIASISCMDKKSVTLSWEEKAYAKKKHLRFQHDPSCCFGYQLLFQKRKIIVSFLTFTIRIPLNTQLTAACPKRT